MEHNTAAVSGELTDLERAMLEFERSWWSGSSPRDVAVGETFALTVDEYDVRIDELIDSEAALEFDPLVVRRLRRLRDRRRRAHDARRIADGGSL